MNEGMMKGNTQMMPFSEYLDAAYDKEEVIGRNTRDDDDDGVNEAR